MVFTITSDPNFPVRPCLEYSNCGLIRLDPDLLKYPLTFVPPKKW